MASEPYPKSVSQSVSQLDSPNPNLNPNPSPEPEPHANQVLPFGELSAYEKGWFDKMLPELKAQIKKGEEYANQ